MNRLCTSWGADAGSQADGGTERRKRSARCGSGEKVALGITMKDSGTPVLARGAATRRLVAKAACAERGKSTEAASKYQFGVGVPAIWRPSQL